MAKPKSPVVSKVAELEQLRGRLRYFETEMRLVRRDAEEPSQVRNQIRALEVERANLDSRIATMTRRIECPDEVIAELEANAAPIRRKLALANPHSPVAKRAATRSKLEELQASMDKLKKSLNMTDADIEALLREEDD